jgi:cytoskeletal protein CcmA (bactofilin family)
MNGVSLVQAGCAGGLICYNWGGGLGTNYFSANTRIDGTATLNGAVNVAGILTASTQLDVQLVGPGTTFGVCHNGGNASGTTTAPGVRTLNACSGAPNDYAEFYPTETDVEAAEIVATTPNMLTYDAQGADAETGVVHSLGTKQISILKEASQGDNVFGIVSTAPYMTIGTDIPTTAHRLPIAMSGRVPLKVNNEGGAIHTGDQIALSSTPGEGMKASVYGSKTVAVALSDFDDAEGTVMVYVQNGYYTPAVADQLQATTIKGTNLQVTGTADIANLNVGGLADIQTLHVSGDATFSGNVTIAGTIHVADIVVGGHIITSGNAPTGALNAAFDTAGVSMAIDGNDTTGTVTITTDGTNPLFNDPNWPTTVDMSDGVSLLKVNFDKQFGAKARVLLSPANASASKLGAFTNGESTDSFQIYANNMLAAGKTYTFTYWVAQ